MKNFFKYISRLDRYIIAKFIGTYIYSIILIISISIVFDINENLAKFSTFGAPLKAIVFDYYANFIPYFANLFSPLFVFIAVRNDVSTEIVIHHRDKGSRNHIGAQKALEADTCRQHGDNLAVARHLRGEEDNGDEYKQR